ncbi:MAG TPA: ATP-binding protein [Solirubrobacteraceae bacterium]
MNETFIAAAGAVAQARSQLADFAASVGATASQTDSIRLAASEAMTNSVLHAYCGDPGLIYVSAAVVAGELQIEIADDGCGLKAQADRPGLGLGLGLISQVSDEFAIGSRASGGTEVRIRFRLVDAEAPERSGAHDDEVAADPGRPRLQRSSASLSIA